MNGGTVLLGVGRGVAFGDRTRFQTPEVVKASFLRSFERNLLSNRIEVPA